MPDTPLQPFAPPAGLPFTFPTTIDPHTVITVFFWLVVIYWTVYTIVAVHHWLTYSHSPTVAYPAIGTHLVVSFLLVTFALSGLV